MSFHLPVRISGNGKLCFGTSCKVGRDVSFSISSGSKLTFLSNTSVGDGTCISLQHDARAVFGEGVSIYRNCELGITHEWTIGAGSTLEANCSISAREQGFQNRFIIGERSFIGDFTIIDTTGGVMVGNNVAVGPHCILYSHDHEPAVEALAVWKGAIKPGAIKIGDGAWIGARVTILPGVTIGEKAVIGAGSVVTHDVPPYCLAVGVPARVLKNLS